MGRRPAGDLIRFVKVLAVELARVAVEFGQGQPVDEPGDAHTARVVLGVREALCRADEHGLLRGGLGGEAHRGQGRRRVVDDDLGRDHQLGAGLAVGDDDLAAQALPGARHVWQQGLVARRRQQHVVQAPADGVAREGRVVRIGHEQPLDGIIGWVRVGEGALRAMEGGQATSLCGLQQGRAQARGGVLDGHRGLGFHGLAREPEGAGCHETGDGVALVEAVACQGRAGLSGEGRPVQGPGVAQADHVLVGIGDGAGLAAQLAVLEGLGGRQQHRADHGGGVAQDDGLRELGGTLRGPVKGRDRAAQADAAREEGAVKLWGGLAGQGLSVNQPRVAQLDGIVVGVGDVLGLDVAAEGVGHVASGRAQPDLSHGGGAVGHQDLAALHGLAEELVVSGGDAAAQPRSLREARRKFGFALVLCHDQVVDQEGVARVLGISLVGVFPAQGPAGEVAQHGARARQERGPLQGGRGVHDGDGGRGDLTFAVGVEGHHRDGPGLAARGLCSRPGALGGLRDQVAVPGPAVAVVDRVLVGVDGVAVEGHGQVLHRGRRGGLEANDGGAGDPVDAQVAQHGLQLVALRVDQGHRDLMRPGAHVLDLNVEAAVGAGAGLEERTGCLAPCDQGAGDTGRMDLEGDGLAGGEDGPLDRRLDLQRRAPAGVVDLALVTANVTAAAVRAAAAAAGGDPQGQDQGEHEGAIHAARRS